MQQHIVVIDNYDSFTYNLVHLIKSISGNTVQVLKNDAFNLSDLEVYSHIILSPGPGIPDEAGLLKDVIKSYANTKPIFGVCLGLQAIGEVFDCKLKNLDKVFHGIKTKVFKTKVNDPILQDVPDPFWAGRYHSWVIDKTTVSDDILVTSYDKDGEIMSARHKFLDVYGVQFHPESIMTPEGKIMMGNFLNIRNEILKPID